MSDIIERPQIKSFKIETPVGAIESDSGNHMVDVASVVGVIVVFYIGKIFFKKYFK